MTAEQTRERWMQEVQDVVSRMRAGGGAAGLARPEQIAGKTGLETMQAMLAGELPYPHIADTLDFALVEVGPGTATFQSADAQLLQAFRARTGAGCVELVRGSSSVRELVLDRLRRHLRADEPVLHPGGGDDLEVAVTAQRQ